MNKFELYYPIKPNTLNQGFGNPDPKYTALGLNGHNGLDFHAVDEQPVYAAHDGEVTFAGYDGSGGLGIVVRTTEQFDYQGTPAYFKSIYWHLKPGTIKVHATQLVKAGDILAGADNTGLSTGTHLHFGLKPVAKGENDWTWYNVEQTNGFLGAIDPTPYFNGFYACDSQLVVSLLTKLRDLLVLLVESYKAQLKT